MKAEPIGYLFNGRFYKSIDDLRGKTMSEGNKPIPLHSKQQIIDAYEQGDTCRLNIEYFAEPRDYDNAEQYYNETYKI